MRTVTAVKNRTVHFTPPLVDSISEANGDNGTVIVCACFDDPDLLARRLVKSGNLNAMLAADAIPR